MLAAPGAPGHRGRLPPVSAPLLIGALAGALYVRAANPAVGGGNSGEFQVMAHLLGIAHPPSYPLYLLLAKGAALLPLPGDVAWRINFLTALLGATAVALSGWLALYLMAAPPAGRAGVAAGAPHARVPTPSTMAGATLAATVAAVAMAAMPRLWTLAVEAEVFTLHLTLVLAFWIALARWQDTGAARPEAGGEASLRPAGWPAPAS